MVRRDGRHDPLPQSIVWSLARITAASGLAQRLTVFQPQALRSRAIVALQFGHSRLQGGAPCEADLGLDGCVLGQAKKDEKRPKRQALDNQGSKHHNKGGQLDEIAKRKLRRQR